MKAKFAVVTLLIGLGATAIVASALGQSSAAQDLSAPRSELSWQPNAILSSPDLASYNAYAKGAGEEMRLAQEAKNLADRLGKAKSDDEKDKLKSKLLETLEKQFDLRQKRHTTEIENLEAQVKKLKEVVQKRQEARRDIINKRLDQLQREVDGLGW